MKLLMMLILCSCAQTPQRFIKTTTTTIKYHYPTATQTVKVEQSNDHNDFSDVDVDDYDFTEIDNEIDREDHELEALPDSSLEIDEQFEGEVTLGPTRIKR